MTRRAGAAGGAALGLVATGPAVAWACSGPGAAEAIARAEWGGWALVVLAVGLVASALLRARRLGLSTRSLAAGWILVLAHPGLWMTARGGDCGAGRLQSALLFTALAAAVGLWGMLRPVEALARGDGPGHDEGDPSDPDASSPRP